MLNDSDEPGFLVSTKVEKSMRSDHEPSFIINLDDSGTLLLRDRGDDAGVFNGRGAGAATVSAAEPTTARRARQQSAEAAGSSCAHACCSCANGVGCADRGDAR